MQPLQGRSQGMGKEPIKFLPPQPGLDYDLLRLRETHGNRTPRLQDISFTHI